MTKRKKQKVSVTSGGEIKYFDQIPVDLVINILSRLPVKSIAKCRCVSKLWSSIIRRPNHNQLFPIKSPATPSLLFIREPGGRNRELLFFCSSPHPQNPDKKSASIDLRHHETNLVTDYCGLCPPVAGLVCRQHFGKSYTFAVISNPVTGEYVTTPKVKLTTEGLKSKAVIYFGYDPIDKNFKVLCMTWLPYKSKVLTLGTGTLSWRNIQCCTIHDPQEEDGKGICINGVLYYTAIIDSKKRVIVCFDVRSEKFSFIDTPHVYLARQISQPLILIDYKGELGVIDCFVHSYLDLWVLKDAEEHKWSNHYYKTPEMSRPRTSYLYCAGLIGTNEIVLYNKYTQNPFYFFCYNLERNVFTRVRIQFPVLDWTEQYHRVHTFSNFVEDAKLMF